MEKIVQEYAQGKLDILIEKKKAMRESGMAKSYSEEYAEYKIAYDAYHSENGGNLTAAMTGDAIVNCNPCVFFAPKRKNMSDNIQTITTGKIPPCLQRTIDKTRNLVEVSFSDGSTQSVGDKRIHARSNQGNKRIRRSPSKEAAPHPT